MCRFFFKKKVRLSRKKEIARIFAEGSFWHIGPYKFKYVVGAATGFGLVISVSKRVGNSPQRNRIKRLIREAIRLRGDLDVWNLHLAIFINQKPPSPPSLTAIQEAVTGFFSQLPLPQQEPPAAGRGEQSLG